MNWVYFLFGEEDDLNALQMTDRAIVAFILTLVMIRIAGMRTFGKKSPFDIVVLIMLGAVMSRAIVGASSFWGVISASFALTVIHRLIAWLCVYSDRLGRVVKGEKLCLFRDGKEIQENMRKAMISHKDMLESVRTEINEDGYQHVKEMYMERNGHISVVKHT